MHLIVIHITINGQIHAFEHPPTAAQLLDQLGLRGRRVALERNGEILSRSLFEQTFLAPDDRLEIVVAVGGG